MKKKGPKRHQLTLRITPKLKAELVRKAKKNGRSLSMEIAIRLGEEMEAFYDQTDGNLG